MRTPRRCLGVFPAPCFQSVSASSPVPLNVQLWNCHVPLCVWRRRFTRLSHLISLGEPGGTELRERCFGRKYRLTFLTALTEREVYREFNLSTADFFRFSLLSTTVLFPRMIRYINVASCISAKAMLYGFHLSQPVEETAEGNTQAPPRKSALCSIPQILPPHRNATQLVFLLNVSVCLQNPL